MTFTKLISAATANHTEQTKFAYIAAHQGRFLVTIMQTNANALDCQWYTDDADGVAAELVEAGYKRNGE